MDQDYVGVRPDFALFLSNTGRVLVEVGAGDRYGNQWHHDSYYQGAALIVHRVCLPAQGPAAAVNN